MAEACNCNEIYDLSAMEPGKPARLRMKYNTEAPMQAKEASARAGSSQAESNEAQTLAKEEEEKLPGREPDQTGREPKRPGVSEDDLSEHSSRRRWHRYRRRHHRHHHHHHHQHRRRKYEERAGIREEDVDVTKNPIYTDPDAAFRESLFDAMADDEGAGFWENVYGQPIHTYSNMKQSEPGGELEQMSDEEYVSHVRARMWEKSHQHILEERTKRETEAKRRREARERSSRMQAEADSFSARIVESIDRSQQRSNRKRWKDAWTLYVEGWEEIMRRNVAQRENEKIAIPWPVKSGRLEDISKEEVETFIRNGAESAEAQDLVGLLKKERVRWHPDKMQQRVGPLDGRSHRAVTVVFQFLDSMFSALK